MKGGRRQKKRCESESSGTDRTNPVILIHSRARFRGTTHIRDLMEEILQKQRTLDHVLS